MIKKTNYFIFPLLMGVFILVASSCKKDDKTGSPSSPNNAQTFTDSRDGTVYKYVKIGNQYWMAENLKYLPSVVGPSANSIEIPYYYVYGYDGTIVNSAKASSNYATYGVLYNWTTACSSCPNGWHLPSDAEWAVLTDYLGGDNVANGKLRETGTTHWTSPNTGATNETGFTALPGGNRHDKGTFNNIGNYGYWWSATGIYDVAKCLSMTYDRSYVGRYNTYKGAGFSVRCVKD